MSSAPGGFTLAEVVVALTLLAFGLLAVASGLGTVARMTARGRVMTEIASLATRQLDLIRQQGCGAEGQESHGPFMIAWGGSPAAGGRIARVIIRRPDGLGARSDTVDTFQHCAP